MHMRQLLPMVIVCLAGTVRAATACQAQGSQPGLVVPVPPVSAVTVLVDSFPSADGRRRAFSVTRGANAAGRVPVVIFANAAGTFVRNFRAYQEWARLVTTRGFAGILYDAPDLDFSRPAAETNRLGVATLDSLVRALQRGDGRYGIDARHVVLWAGSAQTQVGTPYSLEGDRPVAGYVLYYGSGNVGAPRADVPVLMVRAGQDHPALNASMDSLAVALTRTGVPLTVLHHPAGAHGFDIVDSTRASAAVIAQTLDFMSTAIDPAYRQSIVEGAPLARAAAAYASNRWGDAARLYGEVAMRRPHDRIVTWRLGLAQLANAQPADALASFDRARALGQGGARDIGLPATRAALRVQQTTRAVEWLNWALQSYPGIRAEVTRDAELAPLLEHPQVRRPS
jgi:hypothetical protein